MPRTSNAILKSFKAASTCKFCGSENTVKYGRHGNVPRWFCKDCRRKFSDNHAPPNMRTPSVQIASALSMYYEGMSLNAIRRHLSQTYGNLNSNSTIYNWIIKFSKTAISADELYSKYNSKKISHILGHGPFWITSETMIKIEGRNAWILDVMDTWSRFLIASHLTHTRTAEDIKTSLEKAAERTGEVPGLVITNRLRTYADGIDIAFGTDTVHVQAASSTVHPEISLIDRYYSPLKTRNKVLKGIKKRERAELIINGWLIYYNFFRPHFALGNTIPANKAEIDFPYRNWIDVVEMESR